MFYFVRYIKLIYIKWNYLIKMNKELTFIIHLGDKIIYSHPPKAIKERYRF